MKSKFIYLSFLFFLLATAHSFAQSPGGVTSPRVWYKANAGVTGSAPISALADQSGNNLNLVQSGTAGPAFNTNSSNYNPGMVFSNNMLKRSQPGIFNAGVPLNNLNVYIVYNQTSNANFQWLMDQGNDGFDRFSISTNFMGDGSLYVDPTTDYRIATPWVTGQQVILSNLNSTTAISGSNKQMLNLNAANVSNTTTFTGFTPVSKIFQLGDNDSLAADFPNSPFVGSIQEVIVYTTANTIAQRQKIESYLGIKYGVTLDRTGSSGKYVNSSAATIFSDGGVSTYWNNIIGIGNDAGSGLVQKQSHQLDDSTRIYAGTLQATNTSNSATITSGQYVVIGNNAGALSNTGSTAYPAGISGRLARQWKVTNTAYTGTFSIDIKPASVCTVDASEFRLLVNSGTNFSSGTTVYSAADGLTFSYSGGVITVAGITTTMIPTNSTQYITLATTTFTPTSTPTAAQTIFTGTSPANLTISGSTVTKWQYSSDNFVSDVHDIASSASTTLTSAQMGALTVNRYYRAVLVNSLCAAGNSASVLVSVTNGPGGVSTNLNLWNKADAGISVSGSNVTGWVDQTTTNTFAVTGTPKLQPSNLNYNPTVLFDGSSRFSGNKPINNVTMAFAVGKITNAAGSNTSGALIGCNTTNAFRGYRYFFHTEGGQLYCAGNAASVFTSYASGNSIGYSLLSEDLSKTPAASDKIRLNGLAKTNAAGADPMVIAVDTPNLGARATENITNGSELAEAILYSSSLTAIQVNQVESYLAVKYGITLSTNYVSSAAATTYNISDCNLKIIGIGRDDSTTLYQRQSHQSDDSTRIYLSTLAATNLTNTDVFSSDKQFVIMGNDGGALSNTGSTAYPAGIGGRLTRQWKITNTSFTDVFSLDITAASLCSVNTADFRLLVNTGSNFSSGSTVYSAADGLTFSVAGNVITISGITTSIIPTNSTRYFVLAASIAGGTSSSAQTICTGSSPSNLTLASNTYTPVKWQYSNNNFVSDVHDITSSASATLTSGKMGALTSGTYYRAVSQDALCGSTSSSSVLISIINTDTWLGSTSADWNTPSNWSCNYVPLITTDVVVPQVNTHDPVLSTGDTGRAHHLTINNGGSLTIVNMRMQIAGTLMNNGGVLDAVEGSVELKGVSTQTIAGSMFKNKTIKNLISSNSTINIAATALDTLKISGSLSFGNINNATINTGDNITLLSNCGTAITARLADITNNGSNSGNAVSGKVVAERCIPAYRAWRLLSAPISPAEDAPTISTAWQEGAVDAIIGNRVNPHPGYGAHITGGPARNVNGIGNTGGNGFDAGPNAASIYYFGSNKAWITPTTTSSEMITNHSGYLLFVRGDRSTNLTQTIYAPSSNTILRPKGALKQNNQTCSYSGAAGLELVGNPFASSINFNSVTKTGGMADYYYAWDPMMTGSFGVGAFIAMTPDGFGNYEAVPNPQTATSNNLNPHIINTTGTIQSGSAIIVYHAAGSSSLTIKETDKTGTSSQMFMRPIVGDASSVEKIKVNLYTADESTLLDGTLTMFNQSYQNDVSIEDVSKMVNLAENLLLSRNNTILSIEKRQPLTATDTIYLGIYKMKEKNYKFEFICSNINQPGLTAYLEDSYLNTRTIVPLDGIFTTQFTINSEAGSKAADRFRVVFEQKQAVLPVTFVNVDAKWQNEDIAVMWKSVNEIGIKNYNVEKSTDGVHFTKAATVKPESNNGNISNYNWIDESAKENNYYRIVAIEADGKEQYSKIVNLKANLSKPSVKLIDAQNQKMISYQFNNMQQGRYSISMMNTAGQLFQVSIIDFNGGTSKENVQIKQEVAAGMYILQMTMPDGSIYSSKIIRK